MNDNNWLSIAPVIILWSYVPINKLLFSIFTKIGKRAAWYRIGSVVCRCFWSCQRIRLKGSLLGKAASTTRFEINGRIRNPVAGPDVAPIEYRLQKFRPFLRDWALLWTSGIRSYRAAWQIPVDIVQNQETARSNVIRAGNSTVSSIAPIYQNEI
jgi:hypothetical protein